MIPVEILSHYRQNTFYSLGGKKVSTLEDAVEYINQRGILFFWPNKDTQFPSLWGVVAGNRPVPDEHDDPGHVTWGWKDTLLDKKWVYYARILRHRNSFLSLEMLTNFYALSPNYGSPEEDYLIDYEAGRLTAEARAVYEALLTYGPLDTIALRKAARLTSKTSDGPFNKALDTLQYTFRILPVGIAEAGAWKYAFIYNIVPRHFPWLIEKAHQVAEWDARRAIMMCCLQSLGAARPADLSRLLGWPSAIVERASRRLIEQGSLIHAEVEGSDQEHLALSAIFS